MAPSVGADRISSSGSLALLYHKMGQNVKGAGPILIRAAYGELFRILILNLLVVCFQETAVSRDAKVLPKMPMHCEVGKPETRQQVTAPGILCRNGGGPVDVDSVSSWAYNS